MADVPALIAALNGTRLLLNIPPGKCSTLTPFKMRVLSAYACTASRKMLGGHATELLTNCCPGNPITISCIIFATQSCIFSKRAFYSLPAGFRAKVGHVHIPFPQSNSRPFLPRDICKFPYQ